MMTISSILQIKDLNTGNPILDDIITILLTAFGAILFYLIYTFILPSTSREFFSKRQILDAKRNFIANDIKILNQKRDDITPSKLFRPKKPLAALLDHIIHTDNKFYFMIAPTGLGKTTYLLNLYHRYRTNSIFSIMPRLILGHIHNAHTRKKVRSLLSQEDENLLNTIKKWINSPKKAILLLDGLDEFGSEHLSQEEFWEALNKRWEAIEEEINLYGKVIITVREQFLQYFDMEKNGLKNHLIDNTQIQYIQLQPFRSEQVNEYIEKCYLGSPKFEEIKASIGYFNSNHLLEHDGTPLTKIPLILSYIEDLSPAALRAESDSRGKTLTDRYDVYSVIVNKWLLRELPKSIPEDDVKSALKFCKQLAYKIAKDHQGQSMSEQEFLAFEQSYFNGISGVLKKSFISHYGDRSLLTKTGSHKKSFVGFVHRSFMEYFLAGHLFNISYDADNFGSTELIEADHLLSASSYDFTREVLIYQGWRLIKANPHLIPAPHPINMDTASENLVNIVPQEVMNKWVNLFWNLAPYTSVRKQLQSDLQKKMQAADPHWRGYFRSLEGLSIDTSIFETNDHDKLVRSFEFIRFARTFINYISINNVHMDPEILSCFDGVDKVKDLALQGCRLHGDCLRYFKKSFPVLGRLVLSHNQFEDNDMQVIEKLPNLYYLALLGNRFTEAVMEHFKDSTTSITCFMIEGNDPFCDMKKVLDYFKTDVRWQIFGIGSVDAEYVINHYLQYSFDSLINLRLSSAYLTNEKLLQLRQFKNLVRLDINQNQQVTGENFSTIFSQLLKLRHLNFVQCTLVPDALAVFLAFEQLESIYLLGCPTQNPDILSQLEEKSVKLITNDNCNLSSEPEYSFSSPIN